jgi:hypothetical protein
MGIEHNVAGVWKTPDDIGMNVAGVWKTPDKVSINVAGVWKDVWPTGPTVSPSTSTPVYNYRSSGTCHSGVSFNSNGTEYKQSNLGSWTGTSRGVWLDSGLNSEVWVQRTIVSGSLTVDAGSGRLQLSTTRNFGVQQPTSGTNSCTVRFKFYDAASGGSEIGDTGNIVISAEQGTA